MTLKYRGISYESKLKSIKVFQNKAQGKYRGQPYHISQSEVKLENCHIAMANHPIIYRGVKSNHAESFICPQNRLVANYV